jgi:cell division protein FtsI/penicillin-binding protein 2
MRRSLAAVLALLGFATVLVGCSKKDGPEGALNAFLTGWPKGNLEAVPLVDAAGAPIPAKTVAAQILSLSGTLDEAGVKATPAGSPSVKGDDATAAVNVDWQVAGVTWHYETSVRLRKKDDTWRVVWSPSTLHPQLKADDKLQAYRLGADRGQILDISGNAIVKSRPVVVVGIEPDKITNQSALLSALDSAFRSAKVPVSLAGLPEEIAAAKPNAFVEVVTLRREVYDAIKPQIHELDGTVFQEASLQLAPSRPFARALLGSVGDVRKDQMDAHPGQYVVGDQVGQSGLQEQYDTYLRGAAGVRVVITGRGTADKPEAEIELFRAAAKAGSSLKTTLDTKVQNAADAALAGQKNRSALVAVRVSDGAILAAANGPDGGEINLAFTASVPPGSTFKVVTALGLLNGGAITPDTTVDCPKTINIGGRSFKNAHDFELGSVPFHVDFAKSCNTAFASLAPKLGADGLKNAAALVGIGGNWNPGAEAFTGSVPANVSDVEAAAAAFGQGQTLVSPLALGGAVAGIAHGQWQQPHLFTQAPPGVPAPSPTAAAPIKPDVVAAMKTLMREVVTGGTATALKDVPGGTVYAKTGTAEFDSNNPDATHAWTVGWQGDIAFAVFVEKGGTSTATAVPIVEKFLRGL